MYICVQSYVHMCTVHVNVRTCANLCIDYYFMFACCAGAEAAACNQSLYGFSISKCSAMCKSLLFVVVYRLTYVHVHTVRVKKKCPNGKVITQ